MSQLDPHPEAVPDPGWARFRLIAIFVVLAASLGSWWLFSKDGENATVEPMELSVLSLKELYPQALSVASDWQADVFFDGASFRILGFDPTTISWATYYFMSSSTGLWLNVYIRGTPPDLEIDTDEGEFPSWRPLPESIEPEELPFDSVDALEIILYNGAEEFLRAHPFQPSPPKLILERSGSYLSEGPLRWRAYFTGDDIHETVYFKIDAYTGAIIE